MGRVGGTGVIVDRPADLPWALVSAAGLERAACRAQAEARFDLGSEPSWPHSVGIRWRYRNPSMVPSTTPSMVVVTLVLLASFLHASWNLLVKAMKDQVVALGLIAATGVVFGVSVLVVVGGPARASWPFLVVSTVIHVVYNVALLNSYRFGDLSKVYPLARGLAPPLVAVGAAVLVGERLAPGQIVGVAVVAGGLTGLVWARGRNSLADRRAICLALVTGLTIAAYSIVDGLGVRRSASPLAYAGALFFSQGLVVVIAVAAVRARSLAASRRGTWVLGALGGIFSVAAYSLVLWAQTRAPLATVSALRETSIVVAALLGTVLLREGSARRRIVAALVVAAGVVLVVAA